MFRSSMWGSDVNDPAVNFSFGIDMFEPSFVAVAELCEPAPENIVFGEPAKFRERLRNGLENLVGDARLIGFRCSLRREPALRLEERA